MKRFKIYKSKNGIYWMLNDRENHTFIPFISWKEAIEVMNCISRIRPALIAEIMSYPIVSGQ